MKKVVLNSLEFIFLIFLLFGCIDVAKENLRGKYEGTATYIFKYSQFNLGIEDQIVYENCYAHVFSSGDSPSIVIASRDSKKVFSEPVNINIKGIKLLSNATTFNISEQKIDFNGNSSTVFGNPVVEDTDGNKFDGQLDKNNNLTFSFKGIFQTKINGTIINPEIDFYFELKKKE
jgi:hypothetical protein